MKADARKTYHHGDLVNAIRTVALRLVQERGGPVFTLRELAREIGVAHGAVYSHFADKQALLDDLAVLGLSALQDAQLKELTGRANGLAELEALALAYVGFARAQPGAYRLVFNVAYTRDETRRVHQARSSGAGLMLESIRRAQAEGLIQPVDTDVLAFTLWSAVHGFADLLISRHIDELPGAAADIEASIRLAVATALYGVATRKGRAWLSRFTDHSLEK